MVDINKFVEDKVKGIPPQNKLRDALKSFALEAYKIGVDNAKESASEFLKSKSHSVITVDIIEEMGKFIDSK